MVLPEGFVIPPWYFTAPLLVALAGVVAILWALDPPVTDQTVLAFVPWILFGSTLHVGHRLGLYPDEIAILFSTPSVYIVTAIIAGLSWQISVLIYAGGLQPSIYRPLGVFGTAFFVVFTVFILFAGWAEGAVAPFWPSIALIIAGLLTAIIWFGVGVRFTDVARVTSLTGVIVLFGHTLDGVSTAIGYDILGASEEVPVSRLILEAGSQLPTAEYIGGGWLFVLIKIVLPLAILGLFTDYVREEPRQARLFLLLIAAVGLGPGMHNILLFMIG